MAAPPAWRLFRRACGKRFGHNGSSAKTSRKQLSSRYPEQPRVGFSPIPLCGRRRSRAGVNRRWFRPTGTDRSGSVWRCSKGRARLPGVFISHSTAARSGHPAPIRFCSTGWEINHHELAISDSVVETGAMDHGGLAADQAFYVFAFSSMKFLNSISVVMTSSIRKNTNSLRRLSQAISLSSAAFANSSR